MRFQKLNGILGHRVIDLFACPLITSVVGEQSRQMVSSLSRYRWVAPWTLVIDWRRETCRDEHPVEWNASLSISPHLSLYLTTVDPLLIRLWIDSTLYCHLQKPFQAGITSCSSASSRKQTCYYVLWFDVCISVVYFASPSLPLSLLFICIRISRRGSSEGNENFRETSIARRLVSWHLVVVVIVTRERTLNVNIWYNIYYVHFYYFSSWK